MGHIHDVFNTDERFIINPDTRQIVQKSGKSRLVRGEHRSECYAFEMPRYIEGHDMSICNSVRIHYRNTAADGSGEAVGPYIVKDLQINPEDDTKVLFSWTPSRNATKYVGALKFSIEFRCLTGVIVDYEWTAGTFDSITILDRIENTCREDDEKYIDILESWKSDILDKIALKSEVDAIFNNMFDSNSIRFDTIYGTLNAETGENQPANSAKNAVFTPEFTRAFGINRRVVASSKNVYFRVYEYDSNKFFLRRTDMFSVARSYSLSDDCVYIKVVLSIGGASITDPDSLANEISYSYVGLTPVALNPDVYGRVESQLDMYKFPHERELFILPPTEEYPFPDGLKSGPFGTGYLDSMYSKWDELVSTYPNYVHLETLGKDASNTYDIKSYTISSNSDIATNDNGLHLKMLYISCIHGVEQNCAYEDYWFFDNLLKNHDVGINRMLWDNVTFKIIPIANPWAFENRSRVNANGVNLNRNFTGNWKYISQSEDSLNYSGEEPMSEVETQILSQFLAANSDAFFCFNRHGTEPFTDTGYVGYLRSWWDIDVSVYRAMANKLNTDIKNRYAWVLGDVPENANRTVFNIEKTNSLKYWHGTLDNHWALEYGLHGALVEVGTNGILGSAYPNGTAEDLMAICIKVLAETISYPVLFNNAILRSNYRYNL